MDLHTAFKVGASQLAKADGEYTELHRSYGISQTDWELLTQAQYWNAEQARSIRGILSQVLEVSLTIAGMPAIALPGQYVAAVIAIIVAPCNRLVAALKTPDTFDAYIASGIMQAHEIKPMVPQQMIGLVMAYSGGFGGEPMAEKLPQEVVEIRKKDQSK